MNTKLRMLGLGMLAAFAMSAVAASAAQGAEFSAAAYPATTTVTQTTTWGVFGWDIYCKTTHTHTKTTKAVSTINAEAELAECAANEVVPVTIEMNGCEITYDAGETTAADEYSGSLGVSCPEGKKIVAVGGTCEVQIGNQENLGTVKYTNNTSSGHIESETSVNEMAYTVTKDGLFCPAPGLGNYSNGIHTAEATVEGSNEGKESIDVWIED
jgi:hypothetical protein